MGVSLAKFFVGIGRLLPAVMLFVVLVFPVTSYAQTISYQYDSFACRYFNIVLKPFGRCMTMQAVPVPVAPAPSVVVTPPRQSAAPIMVIEPAPISSDVVSNRRGDSVISNIYVTNSFSNPTQIIREGITASAGNGDSYGISKSLFYGQVDKIFDTLGERISDVQAQQDITLADLASAFTTNQLTLTGRLYDSASSSGAAGYVLQSTGSGVSWVATSSLGIMGGTSGTSSGTVTSVGFSTPLGFSVTGSPVTGAGVIGLSYTAGYEGLLSASSTNWNSFFNTPSSRITAGSGLSWVGNTLNATTSTTGDWTGIFDGREGAYYLSRVNQTGTQATSTIIGIFADTNVSDTLTIYGGAIDNTQIGAISPGTAVFTNATTTNFATSRITLSGDSITNFAGPGLVVNGGVLTISTSSLMNLNADALDGLDSAYFLNRANHLGLQTAATISDFATTTRGLFSSSIPGLTYSNSTGDFSLTAGYSIPLTASTTNWQTAFSWGNHASVGYLTAVATTTVRNLFSASSPIFFSTSTGNLTLDTSGDWTGTFDGQEGSYYLSRSNQTGTQSTSTISGVFGVGSGGTGLTTIIQNQLLIGGAGNTWSQVSTSSLGLVGFSNLANYLPLTGGSVSGNLIFSGSAANIALGSNYLSGDSDDEGIFIDVIGNVGIGTTTPGYGLDVETGSIKVSNNIVGVGQSGTIYLGDGSFTKTYGSSWTLSGGLAVSGGSGISSQAYNIDATGATPASAVGLVSPSTGALAIWTGGSERVRIDTSGSVGIGTTSPSSKLDVWGNLRVGTSSVATLLVNPATGNIGIGTNNTTEKLQIGSNTNGDISLATNFGIKGYLGTFGDHITLAMNRKPSDGTFSSTTIGHSEINLKSMPGDSLIELVTGTTNGGQGTSRLVVTGVGNVGIGTTSPTSKLHVVGTATFDNGATISSINLPGPGTWINLPTAGPSGIGSGGVGVNAWIAYVAGGGNWFDGSSVGDIAYRNLSGRLLFGISTSTPNLVIAGNGNVGIGDISPSALFTVGDNDLFQVSSAGYVRTINGNVALPAYSFTNSPSTGMFYNGSSALILSINGVSELILDNGGLILPTLHIRDGSGNEVVKFTTATSAVNEINLSNAVTTVNPVLGVSGGDTNISLNITPKGLGNTIFTSGNVGIGSTSPESKLTVAGTSTFTGQMNLPGGGQWYTNGNVSLNGGTMGNVTGIQGSQVGGSNLTLGSNNASGNLIFAAGAGSEYARITAAGDVGIGTTSPTARLQVTTASAADVFRLERTGSRTWGVNLANGNLTFADRGVSGAGSLETLTIVNTSGNVGIGTTTPSSRLSVVGLSGSDAFTITSSTANKKLFVVDSSGRVGIGTDAPTFDLELVNATSNATFIIDSKNASDAVFRFREGGSSRFVLGNDGGSDSFRIATGTTLANGANVALTVQLNGNVGIGTTTPGSRLTVGGDLYLTDAFRDTTNSAGTLGMVLQSTGTSTRWVATSTLGIYSGGLTISDIDTSTELLSIIGDETGTGALVFSTTPTFTTSITAPLIYGGSASTSNLTLRSTSGTGITDNIIMGVGTAGSIEAFRINNFSDSISFGKYAGNTFDTTTNFNVAIGYEAARNASTTDSGVFIGYQTGRNSRGILNTFLGYQAALNNTGFSNEIIGNSAGTSNTGDYNSIIGQDAGDGNTGSYNLIFGNNAGQVNTGNYNNIIGRNAGASNIGSNNNLIGFYAGANSLGSFNNALGQYAGYRNAGTYSDMIGYEAGRNLNSTSSVVIGGQALMGSHGSSYISNNNVALGYRAGYAANDGSGNNILIGYQAADNLVIGRNNIIIGYDIDSLSTSSNNGLNIGNLVFGTGLTATNTTISTGNIGIGTSSPSSRLTVAGDTFISGALRGSNNSAGTAGMVLQTTGTGFSWVATSTLGIVGTFAATDFDTSAELLAILTDETGSGALVFNSSPTFTGTITANDISLNQALAISSGGTGATSTSVARSNLGGTTLGSNLFTLPDPSAERFIRINADNSVSTLDAGAFLAAIGAGAGSGTVSSVGLSAPVGFSVSGSPVTGSGVLALSYDVGYEGLLSASSTDWNSFYTTPSLRILAGTGLTWTGNTLSASTTGDWTGTFDGQQGTYYFDRANHTGTQGTSTITGMFADANISDAITVAGGTINNSTIGAITPSTGAFTNSTSTNLTLTGLFRDGVTASGTLGMVLLTTGTSTRWTATTSLGLQPLSANLTDLADGTLAGNFVNTANPWADNEVADILTIAGGTVNSSPIGATTPSTAVFTNATTSNATSTNFYTATMTTPVILGGTSASQILTIQSTLGVGTTDSIVFKGGSNGAVQLGRVDSRLTTGNVQFGYNAGLTLVPGTTIANVTIGYEAGRNASSSNVDFNTMFGYQTGYSNTGAYNNFVGGGAGFSNAGDNNSFMGYTAGYYNTGSNNEFIGYAAGSYLQSTSSVAIGTESLLGSHLTPYISLNNVALGYRAGYASANGSGNNILIGYRAADNLSTGRNNIIIGYDIDNQASTTSNVLNIGNLVFGTGLTATGTTISTGNIGIGTTTPSNKLTVAGTLLVTGTSSLATVNSTDLLGGATTLSTDANGNIIRTPSDERLKTNVQDIDDALETVLALRGVTYDWKDVERFGDKREIGFLAQEVDALIPEVVRKGGEYWTLNTPNMLAVVVEAIKDMWEVVSKTRDDVTELKSENDELRARIEALEAAGQGSGNDTSEDGTENSASYHNGNAEVEPPVGGEELPDSSEAELKLEPEPTAPPVTDGEGEL